MMIRWNAHEALRFLPNRPRLSGIRIAESRFFVTLMDTPGHVDFSGEMERALSVLDAALLVVSCVEGVQSHTVTLFKLLRKKRIHADLSQQDRTGKVRMRRG